MKDDVIAYKEWFSLRLKLYTNKCLLNQHKTTKKYLVLSELKKNDIPKENSLIRTNIHFKKDINNLHKLLKFIDSIKRHIKIETIRLIAIHQKTVIEKLRRRYWYEH